MFSDPKDHTVFSNRSYAYWKLGKFKEALDDAKMTVKLRPQWSKVQSLSLLP